MPGASPLNGQVPPPEHRWPKGVSGNAKGRPATGATLREWLNVLGDPEKPLTPAELRAIAKDETQPWTKCAAARRALRTLEHADLADFEAYLRGEKSLEQLRDAGVNTEAVKKAKTKSRVLPGDKGEEEVERELELYDRAGAAFDQVCDRTDGRPTQRLDVKHDPTLRTPAEGEAAADQIIDWIAQRLGLVEPDAAERDPDAD